MRDVYTAGAIPSGLWPHLRPDGEHLGGIAARLNFEADWQIHRPIARVPADAMGILGLCRGLLLRGVPTLCSPALEQWLAGRMPGVLCADVDRKSGLIWRSDLPREAVRAATAAFDAAPRPVAAFDSGAEAAWFESLRRRAPALAALLELQRPLRSLITGPEQAARMDESVYDGRVDFCLDIPGRGGACVVIEIDGPEHEEANQRVLDERRDDMLRRAGVRVLRIPAGDTDNFPSRLLALEDAPFVQATARFLRGEFSDHEEQALELLDSSLAVTRIQHLVLEAARRGLLPLWSSGDIGISVSGVDPALAKAAVLDVSQLLDAVARVRGVPMPGQLCLVGEARVSESANLVPGETRTLGLGASDIALSLDVSIRQGQGTLAAAHTGGAHVTVRSVIRRRPERRTANAAAGAATRGPLFIEQDADPAALEELLRIVFRKRTFRPQQLEIVQAVLRGQDVVGLLPTGAGKSITFQLPALLTPGTTIVVDPLKALMDDQVDGLRNVGVDAVAAIHSGLGDAEKRSALAAFGRGELRMLFVAPERLQIAGFRQELTAVASEQAVPIVVVDEAHCISEWGHDFRPAFLAVGRRARQLAGSTDRQAAVVALTGTASFAVLQDIRNDLELGSDRIEVRPDGFSREELEIHVECMPSSVKHRALMAFVRSLPERLRVTPRDFAARRDGIIVFCPYVNGEFGVTSVANQLALELREGTWLRGGEVEYYSGTPPKHWSATPAEYEARKRRIHLDFRNGRIRCLVGTKAFGMGVDKPDIRGTVHYGIPGSLESLYQEVGRAGRDRQPAVCLVLFSDERAEETNRALEAASGPEAMAHGTAGSRAGGDFGRLMFFHRQQFGDPDSDRRDALALVASLRERAAAGETSATVAEGTERTLYRLMRLGVVRDYTVDYRTGAKTVQLGDCSGEGVTRALAHYLRRYKSARDVAATADELTLHPDPVLASVEALVDFAYSTIEAQRRAALATVIRACRGFENPAQFHRVIAEYMGSGPYPERVAEVEDELEPDRVFEFLDSIASAEAADALFGALRRRLESFPDKAALWWMSALAIARGAHVPDVRDAAADLAEAIRQTRRVSSGALAGWLRAAITMLAGAPPAEADRLLAATLRQFPADRELARTILQQRDLLGPATICQAEAMLLTVVNARVTTLLAHHD